MLLLSVLLRLLSIDQFAVQRPPVVTDVIDVFISY
jgi:hypothetical protein